MARIHVAILGAGRIAQHMADTLVKMAADSRYADLVEPYAVAARDAGRAADFAAKYGFPVSYGSYEELVADPNVDLVYIATPHNLHAEQAILCMKAGKGVLVEKAFGANAAQTREMLAVAKETGIDEVHAKLLPQDKLSELKKIRENHGAVMFVGDGINDAPVLAGADVGAAMGSGADAAIEAADVVFMNSEMKAIPEAVGIAKMTNSISWQNVVFALAIKIIVMIMGLFGFANMWIAVFADTGVSVLCLLNSIRILHRK